MAEQEKPEKQPPKPNRPRKPQLEDSPLWRQSILLILIGLVIFSLAKPWLGQTAAESVPVKDITFSELNTLIERGEISKLTINPADSSVDAELKTGQQKVRTNIVMYPDFIPLLVSKDVDVKVTSPNQNWLVSFIGSVVLPLLLFGALWWFVFRQAQGVNNQAISFGKSKAKSWIKDGKTTTTFKNIAGADEAVEELQEIVDFLKNPKKYQDLGAKIPRGVLLMGPPGCGKTLLARAVAGEAGVAFLHISGSDFVEMFVGVGASRVRDLFSQAKRSQPAIIFVDEIDAVGRHRGAGLGGGHDEREQTLNQILVEMDGFDDKASVIVIAATNRPDVLDPALLRPGRFDRQVMLDRPDVKGRAAILKIHVEKVKLDSAVDLAVLAKRTPGFTGADLANLINEGALLAARRNKKQVFMEDLEAAIDRVIAGPEKKSKVMSKEEKEIIAYHEMGHALVAKNIPGADPVHKISILPRGLALGYTLQLPLEDRYLVSKGKMLDEVTILLGGRAAEALRFKEITTGAANDLERATKMAHQIVCKYGMSALGNRTFGLSQENVFLGRDFARHERDFSEKTADSIDKEMNAIIAAAYKRAQEILRRHGDVMERLAQELIKKEVLDGKELDEALSVA
ncbi:cell division protein FtsH [Candidatus Termititenax persephonae]|uniref:ATP-dependent zinc metalloprotease FtsH n=1 Tax=Candidatus Termititenax persephonae TaxID=2218525 RepID=A0A388TFW8_9BACT|nr:cell division protein FtsH [Candidatus Termititenax persephonae]